jgi:hypothetical protein
VLPGPNPGLVEPGTIDLFHRPFAPNRGAISTVDSATFGPLEEGTFILISTVVPLTPSTKGRVIQPRQALNIALRQHRHLGIFDSERHADRYAERLHLQQARIYCLL